MTQGIGTYNTTSQENWYLKVEVSSLLVPRSFIVRVLGFACIVNQLPLENVMGDCNILFISSRSSAFCFYTGFKYSFKTKDRLIYVGQLVRTTVAGFHQCLLNTETPTKIFGLATLILPK